MQDKERIAFIVEDINMYLKKLEDRKINSLSQLDDLNFYACSMLVFSVLNRMIDLGDEIVKEERLGYPLEIKDVFILLSDKGIINKKMEEKLRDFVIERNKFSHRYGTIKKEDVFNLIKEMKTVKEFVNIILKYVNKK